MENELKPCPCCGGEAILERHSHREFSPDFSVRCKKCRVGTTTYKNATIAVETWNRRTQTDPSVAANKKVDDNPPLTVEELREMGREPVYMVYGDGDDGFQLSSDAADYIFEVTNCGAVAYRHEPKED